MSVFTGIAQTTDSLITAQGRIINADTKEPLTAKITYQSLPYGNKVGVINNTTYSFPMFDKERYSIIVEAPGFVTAKYMLDPAEASGQNLVKDIEMVHGDAVVKKKHEAGQVILLNSLIFEIAKSKIAPESYPELDRVVAMMEENPKMVIQLEGHTDYLGVAAKNLKLSQERVDAVKGYLISKKISKNRVKTKAFGGTNPLSREDTPEAHRMNRRVELRVLQN
ncbi:MAG TPA: OmpA family protein [Cyclobacteriaceae bacterium]|nr:OmpA family protein [Cyclobacteriaceae bacterium]